MGDAFIELFDDRDQQDVDAPAGMRVRWLRRTAEEDPGVQALPALRELAPSGSVYSFAVGESALATGARRYLVRECGIDKQNVNFCGYWRKGRTNPS